MPFLEWTKHGVRIVCDKRGEVHQLHHADELKADHFSKEEKKGCDNKPSDVSDFSDDFAGPDFFIFLVAVSQSGQIVIWLDFVC